MTSVSLLRTDRSSRSSTDHCPEYSPTSVHLSSSSRSSPSSAIASYATEASAVSEVHCRRRCKSPSRHSPPPPPHWDPEEDNKFKLLSLQHFFSTHNSPGNSWSSSLASLVMEFCRSANHSKYSTFPGSPPNGSDCLRGYCASYSP